MSTANSNRKAPAHPAKEAASDDVVETGLDGRLWSIATNVNGVKRWVPYKGTAVPADAAAKTAAKTVVNLTIEA